MALSDTNSGSWWNKESIATVNEEQEKMETISEEERIEQIQECLDKDSDIDTVDNHKRGTTRSSDKHLGKQGVACVLNVPSTNSSLNSSLNGPIRRRTIHARNSNLDQSLSKIVTIDAPLADPQPDVASDDHRWNRKRTADDELVEQVKKLRKMTLTSEKETYVASSLKKTLHGTVYQLKHLMLIIHCARKLNYSFRLATEMDEAEKFDDVVLRYKDSNGDEVYRFLQVKHKQDGDKAISAKDLLNTKNGDFSLLKYFVSWRKIRRNAIFGKCRSKDFILCTNIGVKVGDLKEKKISVVEETETDNLLNLSYVMDEKKQPRRYKLLIENTSSIWKTLKSRSGGKVTDDEISRFLDEFVLAVNQPNEIELGEIIERDIGAEFNRLDAGIVRDSFEIEILDWFKTRDGTFLTGVDADEFFNRMKGKLDAIKTMAVGLDHMQKLEELGIRFKDVNTMIQNFINRPSDVSKRFLEIISPKQTLLTALQICQTLAQRKKLYENEIFTFVRLKTLSRQKISQLVLRAFEWSADQNLLIVDCESISAKQHLRTLWNPIQDIMAKDVDKKMILITQAGKDLGSECNLDRETCRVDNTGHSFGNLTKESQKKLLGKQVTKFQGTNNSTNFAELLDILDWDNLREDELKALLNIMDTESLVKLISEDELQIGRELDGLGDVGDYYVSRGIFRHVVIKADILKDAEVPDLLAISGIDQILSGELIRIEETFHMKDTLGVSSMERCISDELLPIEEPSLAAQYLKSFITLAKNQEEKQFNALCAENKDRNVHWLRKEKGKYIWEKSQGNITYLVNHRDDSESIDINDRTGATHLNEDQLTAHSDPVIISDTAGMGKSTMFTYLASEIKENEPDMLVLKINLTHFSTALAEVKEKSSYNLGCIDGAIQFLVKELLSGETNFSRKVFRRIIERNHKVTLIFDGFDEISPTYEKTVVDILQTLANHGMRKLLVATRPHTRGSLEVKLNAFSYEIWPFSTDDQERFLTSFWKTKFEDSHHDLNPTAEGRIRKYTIAIMKKLADSIKDQGNKFTGIPLQAKLVAEIFERHNDGVRENFDSCEDFIDSDADEPKFPEKINLIYLYEHFVGKKFEIFFKKRGGNLADVAVLEDKALRHQSYIGKHETLALDTLFDKDKMKALLLYQRDSSYGLPDSTDLVIPIERDGIITQFIDGQPRFGHRTYAEYFAAKFFSNIVKKREPDESFGKIFVADVLLEDKYQTMRAFINWLLSDEYDDVLQGEFWTLFVKEYRSQKKKTIFHLAAAEGNNHIIRIFLNCFGTNTKDRKIIIHARDYAGRTAVHWAVKDGHLDKIKLLAQDTDFEINCQDTVGYTPLHIAARMGRFDVVEYFIDKGADFNSRRNDGSTPLHVAAHKGKLNIVDYLLEKGADVNLSTNDGKTPLHIATRGGQLEMVKYLLDQKANINSRKNNGWTPLHEAAYRGELGIVDYLLEKGADVNLSTNDGKTPLYTATCGGRLEMVKYLLDQKANINSRENNGWTPLHEAAHRGELGIVVYLLEKGADVNLSTNDGKTPLHTATWGGRLEMVKYLLEKKANINSRDDDDWTPIHEAAYRGELGIVDYLLENGADVNSSTNDGRTPLHTANWGRRLEMVKYLLEKGANINSREDNGWTPLHEAAYRGELGIVDYLLEKGANINSQKDDDGYTPLHVAVQRGELGLLEYFLEKGLHVNLPMNNEETLLYLAIEEGQTDVAIYLLDRGAELNAQFIDTLRHRVTQVSLSTVMLHLFDKAVNSMSQSSNDGWTLLHAAAFAGELKMVKYLLDNGANVNSESNDGWTPLHAAAREGKLDIVKYLLDKTADVNFKTNEGWTPPYTAVIARQYDVMKYLLDNGGDVNSQTHDGWTILDVATEMGEEDIVKYLRGIGASVNSQPTEGSL